MTAPVSDVLLGTIARNIFLAGFKAGEVYNGKTGYVGDRAERAWDEYVPSEEDIAEVQRLDALVSMHEETSAKVASLAGRILAAGNPLENEQVLRQIAGELVRMVRNETAQEALQRSLVTLQPYFQNMLTLAASALAQAENRHES